MYPRVPERNDSYDEQPEWWLLIYLLIAAFRQRTVNSYTLILLTGGGGEGGFALQLSPATSSLQTEANEVAIIVDGRRRAGWGWTSETTGPTRPSNAEVRRCWQSSSPSCDLDNNQKASSDSTGAPESINLPTNLGKMRPRAESDGHTRYPEAESWPTAPERCPTRQMAGRCSSARHLHHESTGNQNKFIIELLGEEGGGVEGQLVTLITDDG